ncbi:Chromosome partition protein Smc [Gammaproteobacteria bacterium]
MKLKKIKMSGFKSFVDPTTIQLQSSLTGVVGPNGCGKSNIIDAVRWVMGEISAKQLRGESMTDVIFNGSSSRKPVGQASVELTFDNGDASLGGEYAQYSEISIRREVDRNGFSDYFLNNAGCRRRDITNIFLGTGLGPRSYAIIEQGMISKIIEAKPDELRVMIEEAAGISKYKERRRETENRIKHTKENLLRLNDIRDELDKQLKYLKSQASAAERYKKLKQEERLTKAQLHALHWRDLAQKLATQEVAIKNEELQLENKITESHAFEAKISQLREQRSSGTEKFNQVQEGYYSVGANIARLEQQIHHIHERREQLTKDLAQANQVWQETTAHQATDRGQIELLSAEKIELEAEIVGLQENSSQAQRELLEAEQQMQLWQHNWDNFNANAARISQRLEVEQTRIQHLDQRISQETKNLEKFKAELAGLEFASLTSEVSSLSDRFEDLKNQHEKLHNSLATKQQQITMQREGNNKLALTLDQIRNKLQTLTGRYSSLEALQQTALGKNDAVLADWLKQHNLEQKPRLAQELQVVPGWETAVETVLGVYLEAICVDGINNVIATIKTLTHGNLILFDTTARAALVRTVPQTTTLLSKVNSNLSINNLLQGIYAAENITEALALCCKLNPGESIVTKDGIWLGAGWVRVAYDTNQKTGILQRERELQELGLIIKQEQNNRTQREEEFKSEQNILVVLEQEYQELQQQLRLVTTEYSEVQSQVSSKQIHLDHLRQRKQNLVSEIKTHEQNLQNEKEQLNIAQKAWQDASTQKTIDDSERTTLITQRDQIQEQLVVVRARANQELQNVTHVTMRLQLLQKQVDYLVQSLDRNTNRIVGLKEHQAHIESSLAENEAPLINIQQELQYELEERLKIETQLVSAKQQLASIEHGLRELEQRHAEHQEASEQIRISLEKLRTERQGLQVRSTTYQEQIAELEMQLDSLLEAMPEDAAINVWEEKLTHLASRIERLGLINLAAIEEFEKLQERKNYLDAQNQDLVSALNTLEDAIRKIDHDTKERFKEAYDSINIRFQDLFPKIFSGGRAYLEQTANDLLETGVLIMAQPPGKRNSNIHLLSGGEKALTAISLIFSIFQLNPAPFCMLDEVDAPLDDINISRFCNLVAEMAKTVQFIFITHNKLTMEIAEQLIGITMQEAGVSRIVTVDIDAAVALAGTDKK